MTEYQVMEDTQLTALLIAGDQEAFSVIYKRYAPALYNYARRNIQVKEDCEELIQEVFQSIWERHGKLDPVILLNAYLFRMVRYKMIRYFQHNSVKRRYEEHFRLFEAVYYHSDETEKDEALKEMIENGLAQLPERCQLAVRLRLNENLSNGDIAERMNIKKDTVENYMVTAINHLRVYFQNNYKAA